MYFQVLTSYGQAMYGDPKAEELFRRALHIEPTSAVAACGLADFLSEAGDRQGAFATCICVYVSEVYM